MLDLLDLDLLHTPRAPALSAGPSLPGCGTMASGTVSSGVEGCSMYPIAAPTSFAAKQHSYDDIVRARELGFTTHCPTFHVLFMTLFSEAHEVIELQFLFS